MRQRATKRPRIDKFGNVRPRRVTVRARVIVAIAGLLIVSFLARSTAQAFVSSFHSYAPPALRDIPAGNGSSPVADRAIVVVVSGLRADVADEMPTLQRLSQRGASALVQVAWPTTRHTSWTTLLSGADPELAGTAALTITDEVPQPLAVDNLLQRTRVTRRSVGLAGQRPWLVMLPDAASGQTFLTESSDDDPRVVQAALDVLTSNPPDLLLVQLANVDAIGGSHGGDSDEYYRAALRADEQLGRLLAGIDLQTTVVAITSDFGHLDGGGHGGTESMVTTVPLVMAGPGVRSGPSAVGQVVEPIDQQDIASTIAALIGLPIPSASTGATRFDMLALTQPLQAEKAVALADQQVRLAEAYRRTMGAEPSVIDPAETLRVAKSAWDIGNFPATIELARQAERDARQAITTARQARITAERRERLPAVLGFLVLFTVSVIVILDWQRLWLAGTALLSWLGPLGGGARLAGLTDNPLWLWSPAVAGGALAIAAGLWARHGSSGSPRCARQSIRWIAALAALAIGIVFAARPVGISPSALESLAAWRNAMLGPVLLTLLLGAGAVIALQPTNGRSRNIMTLSLWFVGALVAALAVELAVSYWHLGSSPTWYLPEPELVYGRLVASLQLMLVAGLGVLLPFVVVPTTLILQRTRPRQPAMPGSAAPDTHRVRL